MAENKSASTVPGGSGESGSVETASQAAGGRSAEPAALPSTQTPSTPSAPPPTAYSRVARDAQITLAELLELKRQIDENRVAIDRLSAVTSLMHKDLLDLCPHPGSMRHERREKEYLIFSGRVIETILTCCSLCGKGIARRGV